MVLSSRDPVRFAEFVAGRTTNLQGTMQIAGIAVRRQIEKKCTASGLNFFPAITELVYGSRIGSTTGREEAFEGFRG
jgi:hypothetical protein